VGRPIANALHAGVCNTDLEIMKGYMGFAGVLGHEFVGEVVECSSQPELVGKRVVGEINLACCGDACATCAGGGVAARNHCPTRTVLGILGKSGTHAEFLTLPVRNLHVVPDAVTTTNAAFAEPLAAACRIVEQGVVRAGDKVCVVGDGKLGLLCAMVLARHVAEVAAGSSSGSSSAPVIVGRHAEKMTLVAPEGVGCVVASDSDAMARLTKTFDVVVDATGSPAGIELAQKLCKPLGTIVLKSTCAAGAEFNTAPYVIDELRVVGSRCGPFEPALRLLESGLDLTPLITEVVAFADAERAFARAQAKGCIKVQLVMGGK
jgi:threonine dehydrogenase-like Zn-dependent dehydrogenase